MRITRRSTRPRYVCANERIKLIGNIDGFFPDFGHHLENEMGGLWLYPIKLLDGFWMHFQDLTAKTVNCYMAADQFDNYPHKNVFTYNNGLGHTTIQAVRTQIAPEGMNGLRVTYEFHNTGKEAHECVTEFIARVNLRPVWLSEELGIFDGAEDKLSYNKKNNVFIAKDCDNSWYTAVGCLEKPDNIRSGQFFGPEVTTGNGVSCAFTHRFTLQPDEKKTLTFLISGSDQTEQEALEHYNRLCEDRDFELEKIKRYKEIEVKSRLEIQDKKFEEIYNWVKVNTDWLIQDTSKYGRGIAAGLPEYPWWFSCDGYYTLLGILCMGDYQLCRDMISLILEYSKKLNKNGRIVHEILPNGYCPNFGNTQEAANFVIMVWKYYEWTGDFSLIEDAFEYIGKSVEWLQEQDDDKDFFPSGYGITEIAGLNMEMIDTAVYTCEAYECYSKMCRCKGLAELEQQYKKLSEETKDAINAGFWDEEEGLYCDAYSSYDTVNKKSSVIMEQMKYAKSTEIKNYVERIMEERKSLGTKECGWLLNRNWVINTPMEIGIAPIEKAERALEKMHTSDYIGKYGMYLDAMKQNATMTISTGVMAVAQSRYRHADRALDLIERMFDSFSMASPGTIAEMSPDYGCFVQAWTTYAVMLPIVRFFFGINPDAETKKIYFNPCMPSKWTEGKLENVQVLDGKISVSYCKQNNIIRMEVYNQTSALLEICLSGQYEINGVSYDTAVSISEERTVITYPCNSL